MQEVQNNKMLNINFNHLSATTFPLLLLNLSNQLYDIYRNIKSNSSCNTKHYNCCFYTPFALEFISLQYFIVLIPVPTAFNQLFTTTKYSEYQRILFTFCIHKCTFWQIKSRHSQKKLPKSGSAIDDCGGLAANR